MGRQELGRPAFVVAAHNNASKKSQERTAAVACCRSYREQMTRFASMRAIDIWYERVDVEQLLKRLPERAFSRRDRDEIQNATQGVTAHDNPKLLVQVGQRTMIRDNPPLIYHPQHAEGVELVGHLRSRLSKAIGRRCPTNAASCWIGTRLDRSRRESCRGR